MKKFTMVLAGILSLTMVTPAFAGATDVFSVGAEMTPVNEDEGAADTTQDALDVAYNIEAAGYDPEVVLSREDDSNIKINTNTVTLNKLNSGVVYLAAHGSTDGKEAIWVNTNTGLNYRVVNDVYYLPAFGINAADGDFSNCKLALIGTCNGGLTGGLANIMQKNGADCAVGWTDSVWSITMARYNKILTSYLANNKTIQEAIKGANAEIVKQEDLNIDERVLKYKTYGGGVYNPIKINSAKSGSLSNSKDVKVTDNQNTFINELETYNVVDNANIEYKNGDDSKIVDYIRDNYDSRFDKDLFFKAEIETIPGDDSDMIITYRYKIGDTLSDFGYNVNIENYQMVGYKEIGCKLYDFDMPTVAMDNDVKLEKLHAYNLHKEDTTDKIIEQTIDVKFSSVNKEFVYFVNTDYQTSEGGIYSVRAEI